jgi:hypothetical protein
MHATPADSADDLADRDGLFEHYRAVRARSEALCAPLTVEDHVIQSAIVASPPKWHLAHVSWFFETFLLKPYLSGYRPFRDGFDVLFNSYYQQVGKVYPRPDRGLLARPTVAEVGSYRAHVDAAMATLLEGAARDEWSELAARTVLGCHHEQQHQELLLTDIKLNFSINPLDPVYAEPPSRPVGEAHSPSTTSGRATVSGSRGTGWRATRSPTPSTARSSTTAVTDVLSCGSPTVGTRSTRSRGRRRCTGVVTGRRGSSSRWAACSPSTSMRR